MFEHKPRYLCICVVLLNLLWAFSLVFLVYAGGLSIKRGLIVIDPGHGGTDKGAIGTTGLIEKEVVLDMARRVKRSLEKKLPLKTILLTRKEDVPLSFRERIGFANSKDAELFISLHTNASPNKEIHGFEVWYFAPQIWETAKANEEVYPQDESKMIEESQRLARFISQNLPSDLVRRIRRGVLLPLKDLKMPAVLFEMGFITSPHDEERLKDEDFREDLVNGLSDAIIKYLKE